MNPSQADTQPLLAVRDLVKTFSAHGTPAVDRVSFDLQRGETLGLVGESGSGKTTTARCILRALAPTSGSVRFRRRTGELVALERLTERELRPLRTEMQMVFQDPFSSLNPRMTIAQIVGEPLVIHRLARGAELDGRVDEMLEKVGIRRAQRSRYPHAFSGGQRQRIGIARALILRPTLVVADEPVSALDVSVQAQVLNLLKDLQAELQTTYLFVAHNLDVVRHFCDQVAVMCAGRIVELAPATEIFTQPRHPYTQGLLSSVPWPDPDHPINVRMPTEAADESSRHQSCAVYSRSSV